MLQRSTGRIIVRREQYDIRRAGRSGVRFMRHQWRAGRRLSRRAGCRHSCEWCWWSRNRNKRPIYTEGKVAISTSTCGWNLPNWAKFPPPAARADGSRPLCGLHLWPPAHRTTNGQNNATLLHCDNAHLHHLQERQAPRGYEHHCVIDMDDALHTQTSSSVMNDHKRTWRDSESACGGRGCILRWRRTTYF